jgi:hypothetical protein
VSQPKTTDGFGSLATEATPSEALGTRGMAVIHSELLAAYQQLANALLLRADVETALWSELAEALSHAYSLRAALRIYHQFISRRMQVAAEDGRRALAESESVMNDLGQALAEKLLLVTERKPFSLFPPDSEGRERADGDI